MQRLSCILLSSTLTGQMSVQRFTPLRVVRGASKRQQEFTILKTKAGQV